MNLGRDAAWQAHDHVARAALNVVMSNWPRFWQMHGYECSYTFVEFVRNDYGPDTLNRLVRAPDDYRGVFNRTEDQLWNEWGVYLKRHNP